MPFDPSQFGATPVGSTPTSSTFNPDTFGATPVETNTPLANSQTAPQQSSFLQKTTDVVNSLFPGKQIGTALGNSIFGIGQAAKGTYQSVIGNSQGAQQSFQNVSNAANLVILLPLHYSIYSLEIIDRD